MTEIPAQLVGTKRFIKVEKQSKDPKTSPEGPFFAADDTELQNWIQNGGNVGLSLGKLVALDIDTDRFRALASQHLLETFTVRSGGGGEHWYYQSDWSGKRTFTGESQNELGSIRSGIWYTVVPPSIHDETGDRYRILQDREVQRVPASQIQSFAEAVEEETANTRRRRGQDRGAGAGCVGGSQIPEIPTEYPNQEADWSKVKNWLSANDFLKLLDRTSCNDWSGLEFKIAKCLAEGGFSEQAISEALDRLHHGSKWHRRNEQYRNRTVRKAIAAAVDDPYVEFSTFDSPDDSGERGTPDEGKPRSELSMSEGATFKEKESVVELNGNGGAVQARLMQGTSEDGERFEYIDIATGEVEEMETVDGETVQVPNINDGPGEADSIGSPDTLDAKIEALQQLKEQID